MTAIEHINDTQQALALIDPHELEAVTKALRRCFLRRRRLVIIGNGGSGSTGSHLVADFTKGLWEKHGQWWDVQCVSDNATLMSAIANDIAYGSVFRLPLYGLLSEHDTLLAISGSGESENVVRAAQWAGERSAEVIAWTGQRPNRLAQIADIRLMAASDDMQVIEDVHLAVGHAVFASIRDTPARLPTPSRFA